jgi:hypothetical protein
MTSGQTRETYKQALGHFRSMSGEEFIEDIDLVQTCRIGDWAMIGY